MASGLSNQCGAASAGLRFGWKKFGIGEGMVVGTVCCQAIPHVRNSLSVHHHTISRNSQANRRERDSAETLRVESTR